MIPQIDKIQQIDQTDMINKLNKIKDKKNDQNAEWELKEPKMSTQKCLQQLGLITRVFISSIHWNF